MINVGNDWQPLFDEEQAKKNLYREIAGYDVDVAAKKARNEWNVALGKISVEGGSESDKAVFYTSLYRCFERPICLSGRPRAAPRCD